MEAHDIFKRFAQVFEQTYTRFLDLQKAEAQAREAQIENAIEKVRSRSLAMHQSDELKDVIVLVFEKLRELEVTMDSACILTFNKDAKGHTVWAANPVLFPVTATYVPYFEDAINKAIYDVRESEKDFIDETWTFEEKNSRYEYLFEHTDWKFFPDDLKQAILSFEGLGYTGPILKHSATLLVSYSQKTYSEHEKEIVKRIGKVFEQAYIRFLDLQKAEAQTREAVKQASLDRVRGEIASMRTKDDLNQITPLIWKELNALGVPFIRCGVFIMDEAKGMTQTYLSTPNGDSLTAFELSFNTEGIPAETARHWKTNKIYQTSWDKKQFVDFMQNLIAEGKVANPETFQGAAAPPEMLYLNFVPFKQGMLYVGNTSSIQQDEVQLVISLAESFSIAYARYEDFKNLEEAKLQTEETLVELKAAQSQLIQSEKMASLGELTAGIAHEIQNPLNFVNNFSEVNTELIDEAEYEIEKGNIDETKSILKDIKKNEQKINQHGKRAADIVKGMLQHSRTSTGQKELTDINELADEYLRLAYHGLRAKDKSFNADFKTDFDPNLPKINVIPQDIGRVLLNLINNAFYAAPLPPEGGVKDPNHVHKPTVIVRTSYLSPSGGMRGACLVSVIDNGPGIPSSIIDKIFQPFFTTKPTGQGTGLGLSLSYDIVKAHGGELTGETKEGEGTTFIIVLPKSEII